MIRKQDNNGNSRLRESAFALLVTGLLLMPAAFPRHAQAGVGDIRISWDNCDPITVNRDWSGPDTALIVASISGASMANQGHRIRVRISPGDSAFPDAWRFDNGDCNAQRFHVSHVALNETCPAFQGDGPITMTQYSYWSATNTALLDVATAYDAFNPNPDQRYTLFSATFDFAFSGIGLSGGAADCGRAEVPLCFGIERTELLLPTLEKVPLIIEHGHLTWQDPQDDLGCPDAVQATSSTWGRLKAHFR